MTVMVELAPTRTAEDPEEVALIEDVETYTATSQPGCNDDNPYR
ncbi:hypothetical protein AB0O64_30680 [Streptomyces sp. NPDC088341]